MRIACLHTAESNIDVFNTAAQQLNLSTASLHHHVRADLLAAAELAGGVTPAINRQTQDALLGLGRGADAVLLTCSTLGPCITGMATRTAVPTIRIDAALAEEAARLGGKVVALCAIETTVGPTTRVFADAAKGYGAQVEVRLVPGAWALFRVGERAGYLSAIAAAVDEAYESGASVVALAQASMAGARNLVTQARTPLDSPSAGLAAAIRAIKGDETSFVWQ